MKKFSLLILAILLSGCTTVMSIVGMQPFDPNEYALVNNIRTISQTMDCSKAEVQTLSDISLQFMNYSELIPRNDKTFAMAKDLDDLVKELKNKENPSPAYCKAKLNIISTAAEKIQRVVGNKPR